MIHSNERADRLASRKPINGLLKMGTSEIMREINDNLLRAATVVKQTTRLRDRSRELNIGPVLVTSEADEKPCG